MQDRRRVVYILIALAGVLPSALVLWFTSVAIRNEQLAAAQIEEQAHQVLLAQAKAELIRDWNALIEKSDRRIAESSPAVAFYETVTEGAADGLVVLEEGSQRVTYPSVPRSANKSEDISAKLASQVAALTAAIPRAEKDKVERTAKALLRNSDFEFSVDGNGRHILSSIELLILENQTLVSRSTYAALMARLSARLNNYQLEAMPASQRRFLMDRVSTLAAKSETPAPRFPTLPAETLSVQFIEANPELIAGPYLNRSRIEGVWQQRLPSGRGIALFTDERVRKLFSQGLAAMESPLTGRVQVDVGSDNGAQTVDSEMLLGAAFPGWRLRILDDNAGGSGASLKGTYAALSIASVCLILLVLIVIASMTLRRLALAQQKNTMVATVSHELKTPVSSIKLLVDTLLKDSVLRPERVREYLNLISRENLRLSQVIENVLSFSRIERAKFRIEKQPLDIAELIREAVATFSTQVEIADGELTVDIAADIPTYLGDAWALNRAILNLLDNAYKFSDPPRRISVSARVDKQSLVLCVSDKGIGIHESELGNIFAQFYQADQKLSRSNEGCGLGLSIVRHIVSQHDGTIDVDSKPGVGSAFTLRLPLEQR